MGTTPFLFAFACNIRDKRLLFLPFRKSFFADPEARRLSTAFSAPRLFSPEKAGIRASRPEYFNVTRLIAAGPSRFSGSPASRFRLIRRL